MAPYSCKEAMEDIEFFFENAFSSVPRLKVEERIYRALGHIAIDPEKKPRTVQCNKCWGYFNIMKQKFCRL